MRTNIWGDVSSAPQRLSGETSRVDLTEDDLNGRLHLFLIGLDVDTMGLPPVGGPSAGPYLISRQPYQSSALNELPSASLLAYKQRDMPDGQRVTFACPPNSYSLEDYEENLSHPEGVCVSLWDVPGSCAVLCIELLTAKDRSLTGLYPELDIVDWATDIMQDFKPSHPLTDDTQLRSGYAGTRPVINGWLETVGLSVESTVAELLGSSNNGPLAQMIPSLLIPSSETIRGRTLVEGLYVRVEADTEGTIPELTRMPRETESEFEQVWGAIWKWQEHRLVDAPFKDGATLAIREDVRAVILNVNALSVEHHYDGVGGQDLVYEAIPYVAYKASLARDYWEILDLLHNRDEQGDLGPLLRVTERIRARAVQRSLLRREVQRAERFREWTFGSQLRSALFALSQDATAALTHDLGLAADVVDQILRTKHEERERQTEREQMEARLAEDRDRENQAEREAALQRFAAIIAVVVSIFSVGSLFPSLAAIPSRGEETLLGGWVVPAVITGVLMLLVILLGLLVHRVWSRTKQEEKLRAASPPVADEQIAGTESWRTGASIRLALVTQNRQLLRCWAWCKAKLSR